MNDPHAATRRRFLTGSALIATGLALPLQSANAGQAPLPAPPVPKRIPHRITQLGRTRIDPYAWMRNKGEGVRSIETLPVDIRAHLEAENRYADAVLAPGRPLAERLFAEMAARLPTDEQAPPIANGPWTYYSYYRAGAAHPVHARRPVAGGDEQILLDETERARGHAYFRSTDHAPSPDHRFFVWGEDIEGADRHRICVRDLRSGEIRVVVPGDGYGYGGITVSPSSRHLFWIKRDALNRPTQVFRQPLAGDGAPVLVYEEPDPAIFIGLARTAANGFVLIRMSGPDTSESWAVAADAETAAPRLLVRRRPGILYTVEQWGEDLVILTNDGGALDGKILLAPKGDLTRQRELVPHRPGREILSLHPFADTLVRTERADVELEIVMIDRTGAERRVRFDEPAYAIEIPPQQDYPGKDLRIVYQSPRTPRRWIDVALDSAAQRLVKAEVCPGFDPDRYQVQRLLAPASDGARVPVTVLMRKGQKLDGSAPLLLYGYGAYGVSSEAEFSIPALGLVDHGWVYAIAHVRGGSEKGRRWFLDGRRFNKRNSFTDFIAVAEHLCAAGYSRRRQVVAYGLSAGGLLVGAALNIAPTLWAGVIAQVPFVDMLNTMSDATHPLVPLFRPDWGDPLADARAYDYIASISPYENVHRAPYPPVLTTAGIKDDRVSYWEPAKFVAAIRAQSTSGAPALLRTDMAAGHQASGGRLDMLRQYARFWSFAQSCVEWAGSGKAR